MSDPESSGYGNESVTQLLAQVRAGEVAAWDRIYATLYEDLHQLARGQLRRHAAGRFSPTSLVNESWLRLAGVELQANDRQHLVALTVRAMRYVLLDEARKALTEKRGVGAEALPLEEHAAMHHAALHADGNELIEMIALDAALTRLARLDARLARVVELRYFGGLDEAEIASLFGVSERTVRRDWRRARAFLLKELDSAGAMPVASLLALAAG